MSACWARGAAEAGIDFEVVDAAVIDGQMVSSSLVRECIRAGRVREAWRFLGRPHRIRGIVIAGSPARRRPRISDNQSAGVDTLIPADGVYAALRVGREPGHRRAGCLQYRPSPTFGDQCRKVEAHLIDLLGRPLRQDGRDRVSWNSCGPRRSSRASTTCFARSPLDVERTRQVYADKLLSSSTPDRETPFSSPAGARSTGSRAGCA